MKISDLGGDDARIAALAAELSGRPVDAYILLAGDFSLNQLTAYANTPDPVQIAALMSQAVTRILDPFLTGQASTVLVPDDASQLDPPG